MALRETGGIISMYVCKFEKIRHIIAGFLPVSYFQIGLLVWIFIFSAGGSFASCVYLLPGGLERVGSFRVYKITVRGFAMIRLLFFVLVILFAVPSHASFKQCQDVVDMCRSDAGIKQELCLGYIDALMQMQIKGGCLPEQATPEKLKILFLQWVEEHPEDSLFDVSICFHKAVTALFPCRAI